jgi:protein-disulfide isomerase
MAEQLRDRYTIFADTPQHKIDNAGWPVDGDPKAPVTVSVYFMATCPMCKTNYKELYREITTGRLKGKVKMVSKPLGANNPANLAVMAAAEMGKFSEFMLSLANRPGRVDSTMLNIIVDSLKLDKNTVKKISGDPMLKKRIELSDAEATKNGVQYTPSYFIGGRRYNSDLQARWVIDAIEIEYESMKK